MDTKESSPGILEEFKTELSDVWQRLPNKGLFFGLLAAWAVLFQFLGNSTFGYVDTPSLFEWMRIAYKPSETADDGIGKLIPLVVLGLFYWKRKELMALPLKVWWPSLILLGFSLLLHIVGFVVQQPRLSIIALFGGIYSIMGLTWGWRWLLVSFFPFFLFGFSVPLGSLGEAVSFPLRLFATKLVAGVCPVFGIDVIREGTQLYEANRAYQFEVAAACSGLRSLTAILALSTVYGFVAFKSGWKRAVMIMSAVPLAILGNAVRLITIVVASEIFGQKGGNYVHENSIFSLLPYVPAILGLVVIGHFLKERETVSVATLEAKTA